MVIGPGIPLWAGRARELTEEEEAERYREASDEKLRQIIATPMVKLGPDTPAPIPERKPGWQINPRGIETPRGEQPSTAAPVFEAGEDDPNRDYSSLGPAPMLSQADIEGDPIPAEYARDGVGGPQEGEATDAQIIDILKKRQERQGPDPKVRGQLMQAPNPDEAAKALDLAQRNGVNRLEVEQNRSTFEAVDRAKEIDRLRQSAPKLKSWMDADPANLEIAHDDTENLGWWEQVQSFLNPGTITAEEIGGALRTGAVEGGAQQFYGAAEMGIGINRMFEWIPGMKALNDAGEGAARTERQKAAITAAANMPKGDTFVERGIYSAAQSAPATVQALIVSLITKTPFVGAAGMGVGTAGTAYGEAEDAGKPFLDRMRYAITQGGIEAGTEFIPLKFIVGDLAKDTPFAKMFFRQALAEGISEQAATFLQDASTWLELNPDKTLGEFMAERPNAALETLVASTLMSGVQTTIASGVQQGTDALDKSAQQKRADTLAKTFEAMAQGAASSKLLKRLPDKYREAVAKVTKDGPLESVRIQPEAFDELAQSAGVTTEQLAQAFRIDPNEIVSAIESGEDVVIPAGNYAAALSTAKKDIGISGEQIHTAFAPNMRLRADDFTAKEREAMKAVFDEEQAARAETGTKEQGFADSADRVRETIREQVAGLKLFNTEAANTQAAIVGEMVTTLAERTGQDPEALWKERGFDIVTSLTGEETEVDAVALAQSVMDDLANPKGFVTGKDGAGRARPLKPRDIVLSYNDGDGLLDIAIDLEIPDDTDQQSVATRLVYQTRLSVRRAKELGQLERLAEKWNVTPDELERFAEPTRRNHGLGRTGGAFEDLMGDVVDIVERANRNGTAPGLEQVVERLRARGRDMSTSSLKVRLSHARNGSGDSVLSDAMRERVRELKFARGRGAAQGKALAQGERGTFSPRADRSVVRLFESSNLSTLVHESAHWYLDTLWRMAYGGKAAGSLAQSRMVEAPTDEEITRAAEELQPKVFEIWKLARQGQDGKALSNKQIADILSERGDTTSDIAVAVALNKARKAGFVAAAARPGTDTFDTTMKVLALKAKGLKDRQIAERVFPEREIDKAISNVKSLVSRNKDKVAALMDDGRALAQGGDDGSISDQFRMTREEIAFILSSADETAEASPAPSEPQAGAHPFVLEQIAAILEWQGKSPNWTAMFDANGRFTAEGRDIQEAFAESFEIYLREGRAPTTALRSVFASFKAWMLRIYKAIGGGRYISSDGKTLITRAKMNDEIRQVFDRMLATEEAIKAATTSQARDSAAMAQALLAKGIITEKAVERTTARLAAARERAEAELMARLMEDYERNQKAWWRDEERQTRREVQSEVDERPEQRAYAWLTGKGWRDTREAHVEAAAEVAAGLATAQADGYLGNDIGEAFGWVMASRKGLPMDKKSRMERAEAQGFNTAEPMYHGSHSSFSAFKASATGAYGPGVYLGDPDVAGAFAGYSPWDEVDEAEIENGNIVPVFVRGKLYELTPEQAETINQMLDMSDESKGRELVENLKAQGYAGVINRENSFVNVFDPSNVRSINAAFDPDMTDSEDLLAQGDGSMALEFLDAYVESPSQRSIERMQRKLLLEGKGGVVRLIRYGDKVIAFDGYNFTHDMAFSILGIDSRTSARALMEKGDTLETVRWYDGAGESLAQSYGGIPIKTPTFDGQKELRRLLGEPSKYLPWHHNPRFKQQAEAAGEVVGVVPVGAIVPGQSQIRHNFKDIQARYSESDADLPQLVREGGRYYIRDGTHRIAAQVDAGAQTVRARVIDLDAARGSLSQSGADTKGRTAPPSNLPPMRLNLEAVREQYGEDALNALPPEVAAYSAEATDADQFVQIARDVRKTLNQKKPKSLYKFLSTPRYIGSGNDKISYRGIRDDGGEIIKIIGEKKAAPGLISDKEDAKKVRSYTVEHAANVAWEEGYFNGPNPPTPAEFLDALRSDFDGQAPIYARSDVATLQSIRDAEQWERWFDENGIDISEKDTAALRAKLETVLTSQSEGAIGPDEAAPFFKMPDGNALLQALKEGPKRDQLIRDLTRQRMIEKHGDPFTDGTIMREAEFYARNEVAARQIEIELEALAKAAGQFAASNLAKQQAQENLRTKQVREVLNYNQWLILEQRWGKKALEAAEKGKFEDAARYKKFQLLNLHMFREGRKLAEEIEKTRKHLIGYGAKTKQARLFAAGADYQTQMNGLLDDYQLRPESRKAEGRRQARGEWIKAQMAGIDPFAAYQDTTKSPQEQQAAAAEALERSKTLADLSEGVEAANYKSITVEEMLGVRAEADLIWKLATLKDRLLKEGERRRLTLAAEDIIAEIETNQPNEKPPEPVETDAPGEKLKRGALKYFAMHRTLQSLARQFAGGKDGGVFWSYIVKPLNEAFARLSSLRKQMGSDLETLFSAYTRAERGRFYKDRQHFAALGVSLTKQGRLAVALNWGNEKNRKRLMDSTGWSDAGIQQVLDTLDKRDWGFIQATWDYLDTWFPEANRVHENVHGAPMDKVEPLQIATRFGIYRGGYYPISFDPDLSSKSGQRQIEADARATTGKVGQRNTPSFANKRVEGKVTLPLKLSVFDVITRHLDQVATSIATEEALFDAGRLIKRPDVEAAIIQRHGRQIYNTIVNTLVTTKFGLEGASGVLAHLRNGATVVGLGWKVATALLQPLGVSNSIVRVGGYWIAKGYARMGTDAATIKSSADWIMERSEFMRHRRQSQSPELSALKQSMKKDGLTPKWITNSLFALMTNTQFYGVDMATWYGAYYKAKAAGMEDGNAYAEADQAVIDAQGGGELHQTAAIQTGAGTKYAAALRLLTNFMSYMVTTYNLATQRARNARSVSQMAALTFDMVLLLAVPVAGKMALDAMTKGGDDDDEELWEKYGREQVAFLMSPFVGLSQVAGAARGEDAFGYRGPAGLGIFAEATNAGKALAEADFDESFWRPANKTAGMIFHFPASQLDLTVRGAMSLWNGETQDPKVLFFGPPPAN